MLIVEDDPEVGEGLRVYFDMEGYAVTWIREGDEGLRRMTTLPEFDVVLLDVTLPGKDGFEILRDARQAGVDSPVIMVTVKGSHHEKMHAFDLGADDYVTKPFHADELAARVAAVLRRTKPSSEEPMDAHRFGDFEVNFSDHTAFRAGEPLRFTALEFKILKYFIQHRGRTVSRKQLLRDVWGIPGDITTRTIDRHVASLRKKIEKDDEPSLIQTVYGIGYKFTA